MSIESREGFEPDSKKEIKIERMSTEEQVGLLSNTKSKEEWTEICDKIKELNGNKYPKWWMKEVLMAGIPEKAKKNWSKEHED